MQECKFKKIIDFKYLFQDIMYNTGYLIPRYNI